MTAIHWLAPCPPLATEYLSKINIASLRLRAGAFLFATRSASFSLSLGELIPQNINVCVVGKIGGGA